jgi:hypothetical protein
MSLRLLLNYVFKAYRQLYLYVSTTRILKRARCVACMAKKGDLLLEGLKNNTTWNNYAKILA